MSYKTATAQRSKIDFTPMYATHDAFRRDLARLAAAVTGRDAGADRVLAGWQNFKNQLDVHHTVEDAVLWPRVERAAAGRPRDLALMREMEAEHASLHPLLDAVDEAMTSRAGDLPGRVRELSAGLGNHMKHEEESALPLIQEVLTARDWDAFRSAMARRQGPRGAAVYIPWIVDGASPQDRRKFLDSMPGPVSVLNKLLWERRYRKRRLWGS